MFKINIGHKGKTWKLETEVDALNGKSVGDKFSGKDLAENFNGYEFEIKGGSDMAGFPLSKDVEGLGLRRLLLKKGFAMRDSRAGVRLRKTVRGKVISNTTSQINLKVVKEGSRKLEEIFLEQNKAKEEAPKKEKAAESPTT